MFFDMEMLSNAQVVIGLLITVSGVVSGLILWFHRRVTSIARDVHAQVGTSDPGTLRRVEDVERDLQSVSHDVKNIRQSQEVLARRLGRVENLLDVVARKDDLAKFETQFAEFRGTVTAENRQMRGMLNTIYEAFVRASKDQK